MKITDVQALYLRLPEIQQRSDSSQDALLVRITTDAGITGWGEVDGCPSVVKAIIDAPYSHTLVTGLKSVLIGENPQECLACNRTGYLGRTGIYEIVTVDDEMRSLIHKSAGEGELRAAARANGFRSMREDGQRWIDAGITSQDEVVRATRD